MTIAKKAAVVFLSNWMVVPLQVASGVIVARLLGADGKGALALFATGVTLLAAVGQLGLPQAAGFLARRGGVDESALLGNYLCVVCTFTVAIVITAFVWRDALWRVFFGGSSPTTWTLLIGVVTIPAMMITNYLAALSLAKGKVANYRRQVLILNVSVVGVTLFSIAVLKTGIGGAFLAYLVAHCAVIVDAVVRRVRAGSGHWARVDAKGMREMWSYGIKHYAVAVGALTFKRADNFILQYFMGTAAVGYYSVARLPYEFLLGIPRATTNLLAGEAAASERAKSAQAVAQVCRTMQWLMVVAGVVGGMAALWVVPWLFGTDFAVAVPSLHLLIVAGIFFGAALVLQTYFSGIGKPGINARYTLLAGAVNMVLSVVLVVRFGLEGMATAAILAAALLYLLQATAFRANSGLGWQPVAGLNAHELLENVRSLIRSRRRP